MEGQSEDCPFPVAVAPDTETDGVPQWRGSRKTARFCGSLTGLVVLDLAAMEGQSEDCPFPRDTRAER